LLSEEARIQEAERRFLEVQRDYDIRQSVDEYKSLIARVSAVKLGLPVLHNRADTLSDGMEHNQ
jgi:hypothetical protein